MWVGQVNVAFGFSPYVIPRLRAGVGWDPFWRVVVCLLGKGSGFCRFSWPLRRGTFLQTGHSSGRRGSWRVVPSRS